MAKLFVSYSRKDSIAARKLIEALKSIQQDVWVDWESIPPAVDWLEQIFRGIEDAAAFIFMISPDSIASEVCKVEIGRAILNNKRIIPIVLRDVNPRDAPESIGKLNWTFLRETDSFEEGLAKVKTAIELDLDWLEEHRRLQVRALDWHRKKDPSLLLRGRDLRNAQHMLQTYTSKDPIPTDLQRKYIDHSRVTERTRTFAWVVTALTVIALTFLTVTAWQQSNLAKENEREAKRQAVTAENNSIAAIINQGKALIARKEAETAREKAIKQEKLAKAQRSAARAQIYQTRTGELYTSTLFALDSLDESASAPSEEAQEILRQNINKLPVPVAQMDQAGWITILNLNPNGTTFLAASEGAACIYSIEDGKQLFCEPSSSPVNDAIFVENGKFMAMADEEGTVKILNAETGNIEQTLSMGSPVRDLDTDPNGKELTVACANGNITILDLARPNNQGYKLKLTGKLSAADLSPDGRLYAAGSESGSVTVWNLNSKADPITSGSHRDEVLSIKFSKDGRFVTSGGVDNYAVGFDTQTNKEAYRLLHADWVEDVSVPSDNSWLATASDDDRVRVWDLRTGKERLVMTQNGPITDVRISPDEKWIAGTGEDNTVRVWSAYTGVEFLQIPLEAAGSAIAFSEDSKRLISGDENGSISIWDISQVNAPTTYVQFNELTWISKFNPAGNTIVAASGKRVWLLDPKQLAPASPAPQKFTEFKNDIYDLVVSTNGQIGFSTYENEYIVYDLKTTVSTRVVPSSDAYALAFSNDGTRFITGAVDGNIETWDIESGDRLNSYNVGASLLSLAVGPTQIAAGMDNKIIILDSNAQSTITELVAPGKNQFLAFNDDGLLLASANTSGQIEIWRNENGRFRLETTLTREQPYSLAFAPQNDLLAVGTTNTAYLVDAAAGMEVARIPHKGIIYSVSISPDGKMLATASLKMVQLWDIDALQKTGIADLREAACTRLIHNFSRSEWNVLFGSGEPYKTLCEELSIPE